MAEVNVRIVPKSASEKVSLLRLRCAERFLKKSLIGAKSDDVFCNKTNKGTCCDIILYSETNKVTCGGDVLYNNVKARNVDYKRYKNVEFIDCGANLESIFCPNCGAIIDFSWWGEAMNKAYESHFKEMGVITPCCNKKTTLGGLKYNAPCAFAKTEIRIFDARDLIPKETIRAIEKICKTPLKVIFQRV